MMDKSEAAGRLMDSSQSQPCVAREPISRADPEAVNTGLERTQLALAMLCAWNGIAPRQAPPEWFNHPSDANRQAWERVAGAAMGFAATLCEQRAQEFLSPAYATDQPKSAVTGPATTAALTQMIENDDGWTDWVHPLPGYRMQCCDCGLVHKMEFAIVAPRGDGRGFNEGEGPDGVIVFRAGREET